MGMPNIVELAALAGILSSLYVLFGSSGAAPGWSKDPITVPGLIAGAALGCIISAFWILAQRELNSKRYFKDQGAELTAELKRARRAMDMTIEDCCLLVRACVDNGVDLPKTKGINHIATQPEHPGLSPVESKPRSKSPARKRTGMIRRSATTASVERGELAATALGLQHDSQLTGIQHDSLGNQYS